MSKRVAHAEQLVKEVVAAKKADRASERHLRDTKGRLKLFAEAFKGRKNSSEFVKLGSPERVIYCGTQSSKSMSPNFTGNRKR